MSLSIYRKLSIIHSIKCNYTGSSRVAEESFHKLNELKNRLSNGKLENQVIQDWMTTNPAVSEAEIEMLANSMRK